MDRLKSKYNLAPKIGRETAKNTALHDTTSFRSERKTALKALLITPHIGIGALELGMSPDQIVEAIAQIISDLPLPNRNNLQISQDSMEEDGYSTMRYQKDAVFFMVRYKNGQAVEISVDRGCAEYAPVLLYDMDVFKVQADQLVAALKPFSPCFCDCEDKDLGTEYLFPDIGIRLWREEPFHHKLLADERYMKTMDFVIDDMYRYLYFDIVTVKK